MSKSGGLMSELLGAWSNTSHPKSRNFFGYNIRDVRASIAMENAGAARQVT